MNHWEFAENVIYERGIALTFDGERWRFGTPEVLGANSPTAGELCATLGIRPIVIRYRSRGNNSKYSMIAPSNGGLHLDVIVSEMRQIVAKAHTTRLFLQTQSLFFLLDALLYHCSRMAYEYTKQLNEVGEMQWARKVDHIVVACHEIFFEFDALVTAGIRAMDSVRHLLWSAFGGNGGVPSSFGRTIEHLPKAPEQLRTAVLKCQQSHLKYAKEYRDCIQHYIAIGTHARGRVSYLSGDLRGLIVAIPDNPEIRSARALRYTSDQDALTYAWSLATEIVQLTQEIILAAVPQSKTDDASSAT